MKKLIILFLFATLANAQTPFSVPKFRVTEMTEKSTNTRFVVQDLTTKEYHFANSLTVGTRVYRNINQSIPAGTTFTDLVFTNIGSLKGSSWGAPSSTLTCPEAGYYLINAEATFDGSGLLSSVSCSLIITVNGNIIGHDEQQVIFNAFGSLNCIALRDLAVGDVIKVQVKHNNNNAINVLSQGDHSPDIFLVKQ